MVANVLGIKAVHELKRPVIHGQAQNTHVVGVHDPMTKAHTLPLRHEFGVFDGRELQKGQTPLLQREVCQMGQVQVILQIFSAQLKDKLGQGQQCIGVLKGRKMLKVAKANKTRRHAGDYGRGFSLLSVHRQG